MNPTLKIKVCGMRDPENIRDLIQLKPDYIGLIFFPKSKRLVSEEEAENITKEIPVGIKKVGVFVNTLQSEIVRIAHLFNLDYIQLHGDESPDYCSEFKDINLPVIKAFGVTDNFDFNSLEKYKDACEYFLFDTKSQDYGGTGTKFNWEILHNYQGEKPFFLSGGIGSEDVIKIKKLKLKNLYAIDINSRFELEPAIKNMQLLSVFFNELKPL
jgi:phosphoribosylanthranilate isomerase